MSNNPNRRRRRHVKATGKQERLTFKNPEGLVRDIEYGAARTGQDPNNPDSTFYVLADCWDRHIVLTKTTEKYQAKCGAAEVPVTLADPKDHNCFFVLDRWAAKLLGEALVGYADTGVIPDPDPDIFKRIRPRHNGGAPGPERGDGDEGSGRPGELGGDDGAGPPGGGGTPDGEGPGGTAVPGAAAGDGRPDMDGVTAHGPDPVLPDEGG